MPNHLVIWSPNLIFNVPLIIPLVYIYALVSFPVFSLILLSPVYGFPFAYFFKALLSFILSCLCG